MHASSKSSANGFYNNRARVAQQNIMPRGRHAEKQDPTTPQVLLWSAAILGKEDMADVRASVK